MKKLTLKNSFLFSGNHAVIITLQAWLGMQMLHGPISRSRTRFLKLIDGRIEEIEQTRVDLLKKYAAKQKVKEDGKDVEKEVMLYEEKVKSEEKDAPPMLETKETTDPRIGKRYKLADEKGFSEEFQKYLEEELIIDILPSNSEVIYQVKDMILNTKEEFQNQMAYRYDEWCEAFENISEEGEGKKEKKSKK